LLERLLQHFSGSAIRWCDLVTGLDWHHNWNPETRQIQTRYCFAESGKSLLAKAAMSAKEVLRPWKQLLIARS
jgi:hypothetical protein